ncbi:MAG TPA: NAD(+) synthase [Firmicutes bacterium]|nr:NAD(+) synthase [Bacillota bacterium]
MDPGEVSARIIKWLVSKVRDAGARGVVVGLSGGIDSAVVAALAKRAFPEGVLGLIMPCHSDPEDVKDALEVAGVFGIPTRRIDLTPVYDALLPVLSSVPAGSEDGAGGGMGESLCNPTDLAAANIKPRLRMITLYYFASKLNYLVAGTGNRSELTVGYFTKHGDGGVDLLPIGSLVKTQVRKLAEFLGIPEHIRIKPPTAGLWKGQTDEGEMGISYEELDRYILTGQASPEVAARVRELARRSEHKRSLPAIPGLDELGLGRDRV